MSIRTRKTMLYGVIESTYGVLPSFSDSTSPILVENADYKLDLQSIDRPIYRNDLSPVPDIIGRKMSRMTFTHELRGGGTVGSECRLARLLRACSMVATAKNAPWWGVFYSNGSVTTPAVTWAGGGTISGVTEPKTLHIAVTSGGASGTADLLVTCDDGTSHAAENVQSGVAITLGDLTGLSSATITPTWSGSLSTSQSWIVTVWPAGIQYLPTSDASLLDSISLRMYKDGVLHEMTGAYGTFKINAQAGQRATVDFEFIGFYSSPTDTAMPSSPTFEATLPQQVELGRLHVDGFGLAGPSNNPCVVEAFSFDIANKIEPRMSINAANGFAGLRITERGSTGGIDPEATLVATQDFWSKLANAKQMPFNMRVGTTAGNQWAIHAPAVQYTGLTYKDRSGTQALDAGLQFNRYAGDDEIMLYAC
jgi:hypothetical protein